MNCIRTGLDLVLTMATNNGNGCRRRDPGEEGLGETRVTRQRGQGVLALVHSSWGSGSKEARPWRGRGVDDTETAGCGRWQEVNDAAAA